MKVRSNFKKVDKIIWNPLTDSKKRDVLINLYSFQNEKDYFEIIFGELERFNDDYNISVTYKKLGSFSRSIILGKVINFRGKTEEVTIDQVYFKDTDIKSLKFDIQLFPDTSNPEVKAAALNIKPCVADDDEVTVGDPDSWLAIKPSVDLYSPWQVEVSAGHRPTLYVSLKWTNLLQSIKLQQNTNSAGYLSFSSIFERVLIEYFYKIFSDEISKDDEWFLLVLAHAKKCNNYPREIEDYLADSNEDQLEPELMRQISQWVKEVGNKFSLSSKYYNLYEQIEDE